MVESSKVPLSVLIPTKNEEWNIAECIKSVCWANEVVVLDSFSCDNTVNIAQEKGAKIVQREFDDFSANKNWALKNFPFKNEFLFILDADMRVSEALREEIIKEVGNDPQVDGYYIPMRNYFNGKWLKHGGWYPNYHLMIFKHARAQIEDRLVHAHILLDGNTKHLNNDILHMDYKGIEHFIDRHNIYSSMEAVEAYRSLKSQEERKLLGESFWEGEPARRRYLKNFTYRYLPARSLFKFFWMYILQLGLLDGRIGFRYCLLHSIYEYQVSLKLEELRYPESPIYQKYKHYL